MHILVTKYTIKLVLASIFNIVITFTELTQLHNISLNSWINQIICKWNWFMGIIVAYWLLPLLYWRILKSIIKTIKILPYWQKLSKSLLPNIVLCIFTQLVKSLTVHSIISISYQWRLPLWPYDIKNIPVKIINSHKIIKPIGKNKTFLSNY